MAESWIMIVDDDPMSLHNAQDLLQGEDIRVSTARSGDALMKFMQKHVPDLILLDIRMPGSDGFETFARLREFEKKEKRRETPVIFLTGENDNAAEQKGLAMGASDYVRKPFHKDILLKRIQNTIQNSRTIENLTEEAIVDRLTGFFNKAGAAVKLPGILREEEGMLVILDLDSFKLVNDIYGHDMGDRVLSGFADIVRKSCRRGDVLCRIGGDEFLAFCPGMREKKALDALAARLNAQLVSACRNMCGEDFEIPIGCSLGAVEVPGQGRDYEQLFPLADRALYMVKQNGKHGCALYDPAILAEEDTEDAESELARLKKILDERNTSEKPLWLTQEVFTGVWRFSKRAGLEGACLLLKLTARKGCGKELPAGMEALEKMLEEKLKAEDMLLKNKATQIFVLLKGRDKNMAEELAAELLAQWEKEGRDTDLPLAFIAEKLD